MVLRSMLLGCLAVMATACVQYDGQYFGETTITSGTGNGNGTGAEAAAALHSTTTLCIDNRRRAQLIVDDTCALDGDWTYLGRALDSATFVAAPGQTCTLPGSNGQVRVVVRDGQAHFTHVLSDHAGAGPESYTADITVGVAPVDNPSRPTVYRFAGVRLARAPGCDSLR